MILRENNWIRVGFAFVFCVSLAIPFWVAASQLGASLYVGPLVENPRVGGNFTVTVRIDSLAEPVNAIRGVLSFNKERLEVINTSKIGSVLNLWVEEPNFSNIDGTVKFQGGVPRPGFIGNGGTVLHIIFRAKSAGHASLLWKQGEVLASDGEGTNILTNLQNSDFFIDEAPSSPGSEGVFGWFRTLVWSNLVLLLLFAIAGAYLIGRKFLEYHDRHLHHDEDDKLGHHHHHGEDLKEEGETHHAAKHTPRDKHSS